MWPLIRSGPSREAKRQLRLKLEDEARQEYISYYRYLLDLQCEATRSFDKAMLTLSGGALGLSLVFIRDIAQHPVHTNWVIASWVLFGLSLLFTLISFRTAKIMLQKRRIAAGQEYRGKPVDTSWSKWDLVTTWLNRMTMVSFFLGTITLAVFIRLNMT